MIGLQLFALGPASVEGLLDSMVDRHEEGTPRRVFLFCEPPRQRAKERYDRQDLAR